MGKLLLVFAVSKDGTLDWNLVKEHSLQAFIEKWYSHILEECDYSWLKVCTKIRIVEVGDYQFRSLDITPPTSLVIKLREN